MVWPRFKVFWFSKDNPTGKEGRRKRGRQKKREDTIKECTGMDFAAQLGQQITGQNGKGLLRIHLWCPDDLPRLWDKIE